MTNHMLDGRRMQFVTCSIHESLHNFGDFAHGQRTPNLTHQTTTPPVGIPGSSIPTTPRWSSAATMLLTSTRLGKSTNIRNGWPSSSAKH
jgi:hypothetical protein